MNNNKIKKINSDVNINNPQQNPQLVISSNLPLQTLSKIIQKNPNLINSTDNKHETLLSYAINRKNTEICEYLLQFPILDLTYHDKNGNSYLHLAVIKQLENIIKNLIEKGIDINNQNNEGNTALHLAYERNNNNIINLLLKNKIDKNIKNKENKLAEELKSNKNVSNNTKKFKSNKNPLNVYHNCKSLKNINYDNTKNNSNKKIYTNKNESKTNKNINNKNNKNNNKQKTKTQNEEKNTNENVKKLIKLNWDSENEENENENDIINYETDSLNNNLNIFTKNKINNNEEYDKNCNLADAKKQVQIEDQEHDIFNITEDVNYKEKLSNNKKLNNQKIEIKKKFSAPLEYEVIDDLGEENDNYDNENVIKIENDNEESEESNSENNIENKNNEFLMGGNYSSKGSATGTGTASGFSIGTQNIKEKKQKNFLGFNPYYLPPNSPNVNDINYKNNNFNYGYSFVNPNLFVRSQYNSMINLDVPSMNNLQMINTPSFVSTNNYLIPAGMSNDINQFQIKSNINNNIQKNNFSEKLTHKNKPLFEFLSQINMGKYLNIFIQSGFDDINLLIDQAKKHIFIKDIELKEAGIFIPGDRAKILIRIQEKANIYGFTIPKCVYYICKNIDDIQSDFHINKLNEWLKSLKVEMYLWNFVCCGYHSLELLLLQMVSENPLTNEILRDEIGIDKIGFRSRILNKLKDEGRSLNNKLKTSELVIGSGENGKNCECLIF